MAVQVAACVDMGQADRLPALDRVTSMAQGVTCPSNTPVAVTVFDCSHPSHRLLPTTYTHTHTQTVSRKALQRYSQWTNLGKVNNQTRPN